MRCSEAKRFMQMTLAGDATGADHERWDDHIASCPRCEAQWEEISRCAEAVHTAAPTAVAIERNLASDVLERVGRVGDLSRSSRVRKLAVAATTALIIVVVLLGVLLPTRRPPNLFAAVLDAMAEVKTAHYVVTNGIEVWISVDDHGVRSEGPWSIQVANAETSWLYVKRENKVIIAPASPETVTDHLRRLSGIHQLEQLRERPELFQYHVSNTRFDGRAAKRIDVERHTEMFGIQRSTFWIDADTSRLLAGKHPRQTVGADGSAVGEEVEFRVEYDVPVDPALFTFEPPADATIVDRRSHASDPVVARRIVDAIYAGSWSAVDRLLEPGLRSTRRSDAVMPSLSSELHQRFGSARHLELKQSSRRPSNPWVFNFTETVWAVTTEKGSFEMKLALNSQAIVTGIWLRPSSAVQWTTAQEMAAAYYKEQMRSRGIKRN